MEKYIYNIKIKYYNLKMKLEVIILIKICDHNQQFLRGYSK